MLLIMLMCLGFAEQTTLGICKVLVCKKNSERPASQANESYCLREQSNTDNKYQIFAFSDVCNATNHYYCEYHTARSGDSLQEEYVYSICVQNKTEIYAPFKIAESLPGEKCDPYGSYFRCPYGRKKCYFGRCIGFSIGEHCFSNHDCDPGLYCNSNICSQYLKNGATCTDSYQCGRSQRCKFNNAADLTGTCITFYSVPTDTTFYAKAEVDLFLCASKIGTPTASINNWSPKFTPAMIKCGETILSTNINKECKASSDCPTSVSRITAECSCRYDMSGIGHCGTGNGDPIFTSYLSSFTAYQSASVNCHISRGFDFVCDVPTQFYAYMCARAKALNYNAANSTLDCVMKMSNPLMYSEADEIDKWCNMGVQMSNARWYSVLMLAIILVI